MSRLVAEILLSLGAVCGAAAVGTGAARAALRGLRRVGARMDGIRARVSSHLSRWSGRRNEAVPRGHAADTRQKGSTYRRVRSSALLALAAVLASSGATPVTLAGSPEGTGPLIRVSRPSPFATCPTVPGIPNDLPNANDVVEPNLAVDSRTAGTSRVNLVAVWQQDRLTQGFALGLVGASSFDGGRSWSTRPLPFTACAGGPSTFDRVTDPWVSVGPDGVVYTTGVVEGGGIGRAFSTGVMASTSVNGGRTWGAPHVVGGTRSADKDSITADPYHPATAYAIWSGSDGSGGRQGGYDEWLSRTSDGGETWSTPRGVVYSGDGSASLGHQILVARGGGKLFDFFGYWSIRGRPLRVCAHLNRRRHCVTYRPEPGSPVYDMYVAYNVSRDRGSLWSSPTIIARDRSAGPPDGGLTNPRNGRSLPAAAMDPRRGTLYVVWQDARFNGNAYDGIVMKSSHDDGKHWSKPVSVSPPGAPRAFNPSIAVNSKGIVGVTYYTVTRWNETAPTWPVNYWFASSRDGVHFSRPVHLGGPFDIKATPEYFVGDYEGLVAAGDAFHPLFVLGNPGSATNPTDVFTTTIRPK